MKNQISFILKGRPITKKTSQQVVKAGNGQTYVIQKKTYRKYEDYCILQLNEIKASQKDFTLFTDCCMVAEYWMPNKEGEPDLVGLLQSTCDILEAGGIVENDKYIRQFGFEDRHSKVMGIDEENPRVDIVIKKAKEE